MMQLDRFEQLARIIAIAVGTLMLAMVSTDRWWGLLGIAPLRGLSCASRTPSRTLRSSPEYLDLPTLARTRSSSRRWAASPAEVTAFRWGISRMPIGSWWWWKTGSSPTGYETLLPKTVVTYSPPRPMARREAAYARRGSRALSDPNESRPREPCPKSLLEPEGCGAHR